MTSPTSPRRPFKDLVGVVLAGGESRRMGRDKALLAWDGETLAASAVGRLGAVCGEVLVADRGRDFLPNGVTAVADGPGRGPAAGILGAAAARPGSDLLILACDLPQVPAQFLSQLAGISGDWVVPFWQGRYEPLCALYRRPCLAALGAQVARGVHALYRLADAELDIHRLMGDELARFAAPEGLFKNLNTPEDFASLRDGVAAG
jgi:molybdopterin-guanine dinucleotide biosynthesis protein A